MTYSCKLRALEPEDLELVYQIENDATIWPWSEANVPLSRYTIRQYLQQQHGDIYQDGQLRLIVEQAGTPVGLIDLTNFSPQHLRAEVGIVILHAARRQGVGAEALRLLHAYASEHLRLSCLYAFISAENEAAQALFRSVGYQEQARLGQWIQGRTDALLYQFIFPK